MESSLAKSAVVSSAPVDERRGMKTLHTLSLGAATLAGALLFSGQALAAYSTYNPYDYDTNYYNSSYDLPRNSGYHNSLSEQPGYVCHYRNSNGECMEYSYVSGGSSQNYYIPHYQNNRYQDDRYYRDNRGSSSMRNYCYDRYDDRYDSRTCRDYREDHEDDDCYNNGYYNSSYCRTNTRRVTYTRSTRYDDCDDDYYYDDDRYSSNSRYYYDEDDGCRYDDYYRQNRSASQYCYDRYDSRYQTLYCQRYRRDDITGRTYQYDNDYRYNDTYYYNGYYQ